MTHGSCGIILIMYMFLVQPQFTKHPSNHTVYLSVNSSSLSLTCQAEGAVTVYVWQKQNGTISSSAVGLNSSTLILVNLQSEDAGNYRCEVTGDCGTGYSDYGPITIVGKEINYTIYCFVCTCFELMLSVLVE